MRFSRVNRTYGSLSLEWVALRATYAPKKLLYFFFVVELVFLGSFFGEFASRAAINI